MDWLISRSCVLFNRLLLATQLVSTVLRQGLPNLKPYQILMPASKRDLFHHTIFGSVLSLTMHARVGWKRSVCHDLRWVSPIWPKNVRWNFSSNFTFYFLLILCHTCMSKQRLQASIREVTWLHYFSQIGLYLREYIGNLKIIFAWKEKLLRIIILLNLEMVTFIPQLWVRPPKKSFFV